MFYAAVICMAAHGKEYNRSRRNDELEARLARIEAKLDALGGSSDRDHDSSSGLSRLVEQGLLDASDTDASPSGIFEMPQILSHGAWNSPRSHDAPPVPPLTEALPLIDTYFREYNAVIPMLGQHASFMRMVNEYYSPTGERPRIYGAIINIVLALGYRLQSCHYGDTIIGFNDAKIKACVDNAQTMLDELMTRDEDTLGLQGLLGLVALYQTHPDQTPSSVLISAAIRIAHTLRLEFKTALSELPPQEARVRTNLFWVCYILDKDISLRTVTPSFQNDDDIDLDLPGVQGDDTASLVFSADGLSQLNLFRVRVQLAHLEGKIYDMLLSNRSKRLTPEDRRKAVMHIDALLEQWRQSIPTPFQLENMWGNLMSGPLVHMTVVYQTYLMCLTMTHGLYANDSPWMKALGCLGSDLLRTFDPRASASMDGNFSSPNSVVWEKCVGTSRAILNILSYQSFGGCNVWLSACAYFSAMTFVFVNLICYPSNEKAEEDQKLAEVSMAQMQKYFDYKGLEKFKHLRQVLVQIEAAAKSALKEARKVPAKAAPQPQHPFDDAFSSQTLSPGTLFDFRLQDMLNEVPTPNIGMGAWGINSTDLDYGDPHTQQQTAYGGEAYWGFGPV
ncbi:hypothetical protein GGS20DRAFT_413211 [Poronia punctata]|nr:hypothetical protein GGS20DRAFT_413211 [Poronia punctata]